MNFEELQEENEELSSKLNDCLPIDKTKNKNEATGNKMTCFAAKLLGKILANDLPNRPISQYPKKPR